MTQVQDNPELHRYEIMADDGLAGFADYQKTDTMVVFTHTEIDARFKGQGMGGTLVRHALDDVRRQGLKALPVCSYVEGWMNRHPDYQDLNYRASSSAETD